MPPELLQAMLAFFNKGNGGPVQMPGDPYRDGYAGFNSGFDMNAAIRDQAQGSMANLERGLFTVGGQGDFMRQKDISGNFMNPFAPAPRGLAKWEAMNSKPAGQAYSHGYGGQQLDMRPVNRTSAEAPVASDTVEKQTLEYLLGKYGSPGGQAGASAMPQATAPAVGQAASAPVAPTPVSAPVSAAPQPQSQQPFQYTPETRAIDDQLYAGLLSEFAQPNAAPSIQQAAPQPAQPNINPFNTSWQGNQPTLSAGYFGMAPTNAGAPAPAPATTNPFVESFNGPDPTLSAGNFSVDPKLGEVPPFLAAFNSQQPVLSAGYFGREPTPPPMSPFMQSWNGNDSTLSAGYFGTAPQERTEFPADVQTPQQIMRMLQEMFPMPVPPTELTSVRRFSKQPINSQAAK